MRRPSPAMVVAIAALIAAVAGTAVALPGRNTVKSGDIAPRNVKTSDLAAGAVGLNQTNLVRSAGAAGLAQTISNTPTALDGPGVTVRVPPGALVAVHARADLRRSGGGGGNFVSVHLFEPTALPGAPRIMATDSGATDTRYSSPGSGDADGVAAQVRSGWIVLSDVPPGERRFSLQYATEAGTGLFENRRVRVVVLR